jgi:hypothetical protein
MAYTVFAMPQILPRFTQEKLKVSEWLLGDDVNHARRAWTRVESDRNRERAG